MKYLALFVVVVGVNLSRDLAVLRTKPGTFRIVDSG